MPAKPFPWRGALVIAAWIIWPPLFYGAYWLRRGDAPAGLLGWLWLGIMLGVPVYFTTRWMQWRRGAERAASERP